MYSLEEFPPPPRKPTKPSPQPRRSTKAAPEPRRHGLWTVPLLLVLAAAVAGPYFWMSRRLSGAEAALDTALMDLADARGSLGTLWTTTTKLDETRMEEQDLLRDSLGVIRSFAESGMRLWDAAFQDHEDRLSQNAGRIRDQQGTIRQLLDLTTSMNRRINELEGRNRVFEGAFQSTGEVVTELRQTLASLTLDLDTLEDRVLAARADDVGMARRVDNVELWVASFREQNLDADVVRERLARLAADLRSMAMRVDSLGMRVDSAHGTVLGVGLR